MWQETLMFDDTSFYIEIFTVEKIARDRILRAWIKYLRDNHSEIRRIMERIVSGTVLPRYSSPDPLLAPAKNA